MNTKEKSLALHELEEVCFHNYGVEKTNDEWVQGVIEEHYDLLERAGYVKNGVVTFAIRDLKKLRDKFWDRISNRRRFAAIVFNKSVKQGVEMQDIYHRNVVDSAGEDADSGRLWNQTTDSLAKLTGAYAAEKVANISMKEDDTDITINEVFAARQKALELQGSLDEEE